MIRGAAALALLAAFAGGTAGCTGGGQPAMARPSGSAVRPTGSAAPSLVVPAPATTTPVHTTDGCHGLVSTAQVAHATGLPLAPGRGDGAAAAAQYSQAVKEQGLHATVRLCPFTDPAGDQLSVLGLAFADAGQAGRMFAGGTGTGSIPGASTVPGVGDAAVSDRSRTLLARRGHGVVMVYLVRARDPDGDHLSALAAVASAALAAL